MRHLPSGDPVRGMKPPSTEDGLENPAPVINEICTVEDAGFASCPLGLSR